MSIRGLLALALIAHAVCAAAEPAYVTDILRLGIHAAADTSDRPFDNLVSGMRVEVLERNPSFARVRLPDGREGWVKATFLVTEKPAAARVLELEAQIEALNASVAAAKTAQLGAEQELTRVTSEAGSVPELRATLRRIESENSEYAERLGGLRMSLPVRWVVPALVVALAAGFTAGLWWLDARIRRRHGGFRVY